MEVLVIDTVELVAVKQETQVKPVETAELNLLEVLELKVLTVAT